MCCFVYTHLGSYTRIAFWFIRLLETKYIDSVACFFVCFSIVCCSGPDLLGECIHSIPHIQQLIFKLCVTQTNRKTNFASNILVCNNMNEWQFSIRLIAWLVPFFFHSQVCYSTHMNKYTTHSWICRSFICVIYVSDSAILLLWAFNWWFYFSFVWTLCKQTVSRRMVYTHSQAQRFMYKRKKDCITEMMKPSRQVEVFGLMSHTTFSGPIIVVHLFLCYSK